MLKSFEYGVTFSSFVFGELILIIVVVVRAAADAYRAIEVDCLQRGSESFSICIHALEWSMVLLTLGLASDLFQPMRY